MTDDQLRALVAPLSDLDRRRLIRLIARVDDEDPRALARRPDDYLIGLAACVHVRADLKGN